MDYHKNLITWNVSRHSCIFGKQDILRIDYHNFETIWYGKFVWPGQEGLPPDVPRCGFDGAAVECQPRE